MTRLLTGKKTKLKKSLLIIDKGNLVKIQQPNIVEAALLFAVLLEKNKKIKEH